LKSLIICCCWLLIGWCGYAQQGNDATKRINDSLRIKDSIQKAVNNNATQVRDSVFRSLQNDSLPLIKAISPYSFPLLRWSPVARHPLFVSKQKDVIKIDASKRQVQGKENLFYLLVVLFIIFAVIKNVFAKYFDDLSRVFFRTTLKQKQIREQLMQMPLPSLLLNGFFVLSGGFYLVFVIRHFALDSVDSFWWMLLYCCLGLALAYFVKYAGLKICGWLFDLEEAADSYIFIVFIINKMIGVLLLPFLLVLAFSVGNLYSIGLILSWCLIGGLLIYRFTLTYAAVRNQVKVNPFHFFLYLCAFEIAPLLLVYKGLLIFFRQTA
jgi:hypothetical protein